MVHVDAYRVHDPRELEAIGLLEWVGRPDTVVVIEWGERVRSLIRHARIVRIRLISDARMPTTRTIIRSRTRMSTR